MKQLHFILFWVMSIGLFAQAPQGIPYQAVMRNADGTVMSNAAITLTFKIHDVAATGEVVYEETHAVTSNSQGLVSMNVGSGTVVTGAFDNINWGGGNKFLHVLMNAGNGNIDLGTQQMMSVPYALYADEVSVRVSLTGDSLFIGDQVSIVPGVSAANRLYQPGSGVTDIDGNFYPTVIINGQEWMTKNLFTTHFCDGSNILLANDSLLWINDVSGAYTTYNNLSISDSIRGNLYNAYTFANDKNVCPCGWHVPSPSEWNTLEAFLGMSDYEQGFFGSRGESENVGGKLKKIEGWTSPNLGAENSLMFSAIATGYRSGYNAEFTSEGSMTFFWTSQFCCIPEHAIYRVLSNNSSGIGASYNPNNFGFSIRCIKDY